MAAKSSKTSMMRFTLLDHMIMNYVLVLTLMSTLDSGPANQSVTTVIQDDIDIRDLTLEIWWLQNHGVWERQTPGYNWGACGHYWVQRWHRVCVFSRWWPSIEASCQLFYHHTQHNAPGESCLIRIGEDMSIWTVTISKVHIIRNHIVMCDPSATCNTIMYDYGLSYRPPIILEGENYDMRQKIEKVVFRFTSRDQGWGKNFRFKVMLLAIW